MKTAILLDFDDTLLDTQQFIKERDKFTAVPQATRQKIEQHVREYRAGQHRTFNYFRVLTEEEKIVMHEQLVASVSKLLFQDVLPWLANLDKNQYQAIIFTHGDEDFQQRKIRATELNLPVICVDSDNKTELISGWWRGDHYLVDDQKFARIMLVDDKAKNFDGFDKLPGARGFLMQRGIGHRVPQVVAKLPKNVSVISSLDQIML